MTPAERLAAYKVARADLPMAILARRTEGATHQQIADEAGLTREGVRKILARHGGR